MDALSALPAILATALVAAASPGPATLAIVGTAMADGRRTALRLALGVLSGSLIWSIAAAAGLAALMLTHGWIVQAIRYAGAVYLACLAWTCARAAWRGGAATGMAGGARPYRRGLMLHLTNPKAVFFFGALYALMLTPGQPAAALALVVAAVGAVSATVFLGYALLFSHPAAQRTYARGARWIHGLSAVAFGAFALRLALGRPG